MKEVRIVTKSMVILQKKYQDALSLRLNKSVVCFGLLWVKPYTSMYRKISHEQNKYKCGNKKIKFNFDFIYHIYII